MTEPRQWLGLAPNPDRHIGEAVARDAASAYLDAAAIKEPILPAGELAWDALGKAVWRYCFAGPVDGAPETVLDVDAVSGAHNALCFTIPVRGWPTLFIRRLHPPSGFFRRLLATQLRRPRSQDSGPEADVG